MDYSMPGFPVHYQLSELAIFNFKNWVLVYCWPLNFLKVFLLVFQQSTHTQKSTQNIAVQFSEWHSESLKANICVPEIPGLGALGVEAVPCGFLGTEAFYFFPVSWREDSSLCDLPWAPKGRFKQLLIKGGAAKKPPEARLRFVTQSYPTLCNPVDCSTPGLPVHHQLPGLAQTHIHWVGDAIQLSHPLSPPSAPALNLSHHQDLFQWVSSLHQVTKVLEFQLQHQSFQWTPRTDLLYNGLVGSPCSPRDSQESLQHHSSKASILWRSAFFIVQISHPYMATGKTIALTKWTLVGKVMSLLFNMLSRLVIAFLPRRQD